MVKILNDGDNLIFRCGKRVIRILVFDEATLVFTKCEVDNDED